MEHVNIKTAKRILTESVHIYLEKDKSGKYRIAQNRQRPLFFLGAAGIGKTEIVAQVAEECKIGFVSYSLTHHTRQSAVGLPSIVTRECEGNEYEATEYTMSEIVDSIYQCIREGHKEGILFVDEVNCVSETLSAVMLQFLQNKCFGTHRIPQGWVVAAAGNPPEYNKSVKEFDAVTCDRLRIIYLEPDVEIWMEYAEQKGIHPVILSFLRNNTQGFYLCAKKGKKQQIVTARAWEDLSNILESYEDFGYEVTNCLIKQFIQHEETAHQFFNYYELYRKVLQEDELESIFNGENCSRLLKKLQKADFQSRWVMTSIFLKKLECSAKPIVTEIKNLREKDSSLFDSKSKVEKWHLMLNRCLEFVDRAFGRETEMEYMISSLCRNHDTGYLLAVRKNEVYWTLHAQMNENEEKMRYLRRDMKLAVGK